MEALDAFGFSSKVSSVIGSDNVCATSCSICLICSTVFLGFAVVLTSTKGFAALARLRRA